MSIKFKIAMGFIAVFMSAGAQAGSISPDSYSATIGIGETVMVEKTVTTDAGGISKVDVYFLADNTGSMGGVLANVKASASDLLAGLNAAYSDAAFGVGRFLGDPREGVAPATAYQTLTEITTAGAPVIAGINSWFASGGGDAPEANFFALQQAATEGALTSGGVTSGQATGWREGAQKVIVWFGDNSSHTDTVSQAEAIAALTGEKVITIGLNSRGPGAGIDIAGQASAIAAATSGGLVNNFSGLSGDALVAAVIGAIGEVTSTVDIALSVLGGVPAGLDVTFECTDVLGCDDVAGGDSRTLKMSVTGLEAGTYDFDVIASGIAGAVEHDSITVSGTVPEPSILFLIGAGIMGMTRSRRLTAA